MAGWQSVRHESPQANGGCVEALARVPEDPRFQPRDNAGAWIRELGTSQHPLEPAEVSDKGGQPFTLVGDEFVEEAP